MHALTLRYWLCTVRVQMCSQPCINAGMCVYFGVRVFAEAVSVDECKNTNKSMCRRCVWAHACHSVRKVKIEGFPLITHHSILVFRFSLPLILSLQLHLLPCSLWELHQTLHYVILSWKNGQTTCGSEQL